MNTPYDCYTFDAKSGKTKQKITLQRRGRFLSLLTLGQRITLGNPAPKVESQKISSATLNNGRLCMPQGDSREILLHIEEVETVERKKGNIIVQIGHVFQISWGTSLLIRNPDGEAFLFEVEANGNVKSEPVKVTTPKRKTAEFPKPQTHLRLSLTVF